jgi:prevent-host-death family protein
MRSVTIQEAKTQLSALLRLVESGEEVEIRRGAAPIARLVPTDERRAFADLRGAFESAGPLPPPDVWEPDPEDAILFGLADSDD